MSSSSRSLIVLQLCVLSLLSAFLLFQVQPVISKFILPWFGGSPGVWTTCMLFFQVVLFLGYAYAHFLTRLPRRWQGIIHAVLVVAAAVSLPIAPGAQWEPKGGADPTQGILTLLLANVALPYFVLSSTSPLVQVWFSRAGNGRAPWRLYALSNLGSLVALLSYPFVFEPMWDVMQQTQMWSWGFGAFALLSLLGAYQDRKQGDEAAAPGATGNELAPAPSLWRRMMWLLLPAVASAFLLASTNHLCQDVAVIPFLWVVPLSLYLLTFIICFEHERWYLRATIAVLAVAAIFAAARPADAAGILSSIASLLSSKDESFDFMPDFRWEIALVCVAMFLGCMVCHGELARLKPHPSRLTEFYLMMSAGGALGGLFVSLVAPRIFQTYLEWPGVLVVTMGIATIIATFTAWGTPHRWVRALVVLAAAWLCYKGAGLVEASDSNASRAVKLIFSMTSSSTGRVVTLIGFIIASLGAIALVVRGPERWSRLVSASAAASFLGAGVWWVALYSFKTEPRIEIVRNFYGVISVEDEIGEEGFGQRTLYHGSIIHGQQHLAEEDQRTPLSYYGHSTGIGKALLTLKDNPEARVGVVGMGTGTVAAYGDKGQVFRFYDINPDIVRLARSRFTYLESMEKAGGKVEVAMGDARLSMKNEPAQNFDVMLLDAFSGDSVPVHLLTREAFEIYQRHLKPDGIIAVHVSNRYLSLAPVIDRVAESLGWKTTRVFTELDGFDEATDYVLVTNNEAFLQANPKEDPEEPEPQPKSLWTDKQYNLFEVLTKGSTSMGQWAESMGPKIGIASGGVVLLGICVILIFVNRKSSPKKAPDSP